MFRLDNAREWVPLQAQRQWDEKYDDGKETLIMVRDHDLQPSQD